MKYLFTTANKAFVFCLCLFACIANTEAQKNTDSPYSRYGIGLLSNTSLNGNFGMGGVGYAWRPYHYKPLIYDSLARSNAQLNDRGSNFINLKNPASFSNISLTTFEAAIFSKNTTYTGGGQSRTGSNTQLGHMAVGFPLGQKMGVAFGIKPFSSVGYDYEIASTIGNDNDEVLFQYEGSGGVNQIFAGTAIELLQNFSLGITASYLFGNIIDDRRVVFENSENFFNTYDQRDNKVRDIRYEFGLQYFKELKNNKRIIVGITASPVNKLTTEKSQLIRNYQGNNGTEFFKDTVLFVDEKQSSIGISPTYGIGFGYEHKKKWILAADYTSAQKADGEKKETGIEFNAYNKVNVGFEKFTNSGGFGSYWRQIGYRAGMNYNSAIVSIEGEDISQFGISFGISMPLRKSFSTLNFGVELGRRGKEEANLTQEDFFNFQFGVTINDKWFIKRKYD